MDFKEKILKKYEDFSLLDNKIEKDILRSEIKSMLAEHSKMDSDYYHILGLLNYNSYDWKENIKTSIQNFKKAIELDKNNFLSQLYLAHCYQDLNQLELALENYKKVNQQKLKNFQLWRYVKLIEQIGYCNYKLGNKSEGIVYFKKVLKWYQKSSKNNLATPSELLKCLPDDHQITIKIKKIEDYLD